jgi:hypothetical protein
LVSQQFSAAQWCEVIPFAMSKGDQFRWLVRLFGPATYGSAEYRRQAEELVAISAGLTDRQKMISEYWWDGPNSEQPPGHWMLFAQYVSARDHHTVDEDVKMFFTLTNTLLDAGIAAWDTKKNFDSVRPVTAITLLFQGKRVRAWGGPGKGTVEMDGSHWMPYQPATSPTPPFPDYVSGHSTFSAAAAQILRLWTGSEKFGASVTLPTGGSRIEPGITPAHPVGLQWDTFSGGRRRSRHVQAVRRNPFPGSGPGGASARAAGGAAVLGRRAELYRRHGFSRSSQAGRSGPLARVTPLF